MSAELSVRFDELPWDERRGTRSMAMFILTEAMLFVALFFSYFYLGMGKPHWPTDEPPKLLLATIMLVVLLSSSVLVFLAERAAKHRRITLARGYVAGSLLLGLAFLALQVREYANHLKTLRPTDDAYGSIFYTITSIHGAHVLLGLLMLAYAIALPRPEHTDSPPYRALHNAGLYWHFVDGVWVAIVGLLYYLPNLQQP